MHKKIKPIFKKIHLYLGLFSGLILFIICFTGALYAFKTEIQLITIPELRVDNKEGLTRLSNSAIYQKFLNSTSSKESKVFRIYEYKDPTRSIVFLTKKENNYYQSIINPYSGELLLERKFREDFFIIILEIHRNLLLGEIGGQIIAWSVVVFIVSLFIGLYLWYPSNKKILKSKKGRQSKFWINPKAKGSKLWLDLHNILGFYSSIFLIILSLTGLVWSFSWVDAMVYRLVTFEKKTKKEKVVIPVSLFDYKSLDYIDQKVPNNKNSKFRIIFFPKDSIHPLRVNQYSEEGVYGYSNNYSLNPENGEIIKEKLDENKNNGEKLKSLNYDIHTGSIFGFFGKLFVFIISLIGASLPLTGLIMYIRKKRKSKKRT